MIYEKYRFQTPILLLGFNRPEQLLQRIYELSLQEIGPLIISIDGGGMSASEISRIQNDTRILLQDKNYEFRIHEFNLGLCHHLTRAITEVLCGNEYVIILEDDVAIGKNFYKNIQGGIDHSRKIQEIAAISSFSATGRGFLRFIEARWRKTRYFNCWGWAVSSKVWQKYELNLAPLNIEDELHRSRTWNSLSRHQKKVWLGRFARVQKAPLSTWDIQFQFMCFRYEMVNLAPTKRFSDNTGFDDVRAEHTSGKKPRWMSLSVRYNGVISKQKSIPRLFFYERILDSNTFAGDSQFLATLRRFKEH